MPRKAGYTFDDHALYRDGHLRLARPPGLSDWQWQEIAAGMCQIFNRQ